MEYTGKFNGRDGGLGMYDKAAIRYGYGQVVEVFNQSPNMDALKPLMQEPEDGSFLAEVSVVRIQEMRWKTPSRRYITRSIRSSLTTIWTPFSTGVWFAQRMLAILWKYLIGSARTSKRV